MGILMVDSMGWPYDSFNCLSLLSAEATALFKEEEEEEEEKKNGGGGEEEWRRRMTSENP